MSRLLSNDGIGDLLDLDKEKEYDCSLGSVFTVDVDAVVEAQDASTLKTVATWLRSRWTPVGAQFNITAADLDRLDEGKAPQGMSE